MRQKKLSLESMGCADSNKWNNLEENNIQEYKYYHKRIYKFYIIRNYFLKDKNKKLMWQFFIYINKLLSNT